MCIKERTPVASGPDWPGWCRVPVARQLSSGARGACSWKTAANEAGGAGERATEIPFLSLHPLLSSCFTRSTRYDPQHTYTHTQLLPKGAGVRCLSAIMPYDISQRLIFAQQKSHALKGLRFWSHPTPSSLIPVLAADWNRGKKTHPQDWEVWLRHRWRRAHRCARLVDWLLVMLRAGNASFQKSPCFALENPTQKKTGRLTSSKASIISKAGCQKKKLFWQDRSYQCVITCKLFPVKSWKPERVK